MEAGINQYYDGQPVVTLGMDVYNGSAAAVEVFRDVTGVTFPLLTMGASYANQNQASFRKVVIDPDGIVRYVSAAYELNVNTIRSHVDQWLPLDEPTFTFEMHDTLVTYEDGFNFYTFHGVIDNLQNQERQLRLVLTQLEVPDPLRGYSICTFRGCYPPDSGTIEILETYDAMSHDTGAAVYIYNLAVNSETGFMDTSTIVGNYSIRISVENPLNAEELIAYDLYLEYGTSVTPRIVPVANSHALIRNYPNPFNPETTVQFVVSKPGAVTLNVYNLLGQNVASLIDAPFMASGTYNANWRAMNAQGLPLPSGNYLLELNNAGQRAVHKVVLAR